MAVEEVSGRKTMQDQRLIPRAMTSSEIVRATVGGWRDLRGRAEVW
jgi:hypothetical protein